MTRIVITVDLRSVFGPARDQGPRPTCLAFAASDTHAAVRTSWKALSCEYIFFHAQQRAGRGPSEGALLSSMLDALRHDGQPEEKGWLYLSTTPVNAASWRPPRRVGPLFRRASATPSHTVDQVISELDLARPIIVLTTLSRAFYSPTAEAVIDPAPGETPEPWRRHAVIAVGHGTVDERRAILVRNSWGTRWGAMGYGWLTEQFLGPRIFAAAVLTDDVNVSGGTAAT